MEKEIVHPGGEGPASIALDDRVERIKSRKYECFMEGHEEMPWSPGRCADYAGRGSLAVHLFRCKRKSGYGLEGLFCSQHAKATPSQHLHAGAMGRDGE